MEVVNIMRYSYLGCFQITSGAIVIGEPNSDFHRDANAESVITDTQLKLNDLIEGFYNAYHVIDDEGTVVQFAVLHNTINLKEMINMPIGEVKGYVRIGTGHSFYLVDSDYLDDRSSCYYSLEEKANYSCSDIRTNLLKSEYSKSVCNEILSITEEKSFISGSEILSITAMKPVWNGFGEFVDSDQWSIEIENALITSYKNSIPLQGGFASLCNEGAYPCRVYLNDDNKIHAVTINLY